MDCRPHKEFRLEGLHIKRKSANELKQRANDPYTITQGNEEL